MNQRVVSCIGDDLSMTLNGEKLGSVQNSELSQGQIGLAITSKGKAEVVFDNLTVSGTADQAGLALSQQGTPPGVILDR